jgi:hypothetical protein
MLQVPVAVLAEFQLMAITTVEPVRLPVIQTHRALEPEVVPLRSFK